MLQQILDIGFVADCIAACKKTILRFIEKSQFSKSPRDYLRKNIQALHQAIKNKDKMNAHDSFRRLADRFKIDYKSSEIFDGEADWELITEKFLQILNSYEKLNDDQKSMTSEEIDNIKMDLTAFLEASLEDDGADCLECGNKIPVKANKCPKCGWAWGT